MYVETFIANIVDESLAHYGVLGMKWGKRKTGGSSPTIRDRLAERKARQSEDYTTAKAIKKKKLSEMSNDEVKQLVTRMQLEKQFKDLNPSVVNMGAKIVTDVLKESVKQELATQVRGGIKTAKDRRNAG